MKRDLLWKTGGTLGICCWAALVTLAPSQSAESKSDRPGATLVSPKRGDTVGRTYEVIGQLAVAGQPLVLIQPYESDGEWYIQAPAEVNDRGFFKSKVRFGNDKTADGSKFHVAIVVIRSAEEAELFRGKESLPAIPKVLARSEVTSVTLRKADSSEPVERQNGSGKVLQLKVNSKVKPRTLVTGKLDTKGWPVVVVRSAEPNDSWWVQGPATLQADGLFTVEVRFGNEKTRSGQKFHLAVLTLASAKEAEPYAIGQALPTLPPGVPHSEEVIVELERPASPVESTAPALE